jgi:hypothetical protein
MPLVLKGRFYLEEILYMIKRFILIKSRFAEDFTDECQRFITEYQKQGLHTEIQYSTVFDGNFNRFEYTAMIIGRESE